MASKDIGKYVNKHTHTLYRNVMMTPNCEVRLRSDKKQERAKILDHNIKQIWMEAIRVKLLKLKNSKIFILFGGGIIRGFLKC